MNISIERIRLNRQGYDKRGTYWGAGEPLFYSSTVDEANGGALPLPQVAYTRARSLRDARIIFADRMRMIQSRARVPSMMQTVQPALDRMRSGLEGYRSRRGESSMTEPERLMERSRTAIANAEERAEMLQRSLQRMDCQESFDHAVDVASRIKQAQDDFFEALPEAGEFNIDSDKRIPIDRAMMEFRQKCLVTPKTPWFKRVFKR